MRCCQPCAFVVSPARAVHDPGAVASGHYQSLRHPLCFKIVVGLPHVLRRAFLCGMTTTTIRVNAALIHYRLYRPQVRRFGLVCTLSKHLIAPPYCPAFTHLPLKLDRSSHPSPGVGNVAGDELHRALDSIPVSRGRHDCKHAYKGLYRALRPDYIFAVAHPRNPRLRRRRERTPGAPLRLIPCDVRREGGSSLVMGGESHVMFEGREDHPL